MFQHVEARTRSEDGHLRDERAVVQPATRKWPVCFGEKGKEVRHSETILLVWTVALVMAAMMVASACPLC
jgi:hypothetical protein